MRVLAWISLAFLLGSYICRPLADPDLWWHITVGRWIVANKDVPVVDYWNAFGAGQPWRAYSWSNEVVYALVDGLYGERGLLLAQMALAITIALVMQYVFGILAGDLFIGALLGAYTTASFHAHFSLRPQSFVWILFILVIALADATRRNALTRGGMLGALALGCAWANSHLSAIMGLVTILAWPVGIDAPRSIYKRVGILAVCFLAGTLVSPYLGGEWFTLFEKSDHIGRFRAIDEFKPATLLQHSTGMLVLQGVLLIVLCFSSRCVPQTGALLLAGVWALFGLGVVKFMPFASITASALLAVWWRDRAVEREASEVEGSLEKGLLLVRSLCLRLHPQTLGALGFFMCCLAWVSAARSVKHPVNEVQVPKSSVAFIKDNGLQHPILGDMGLGGLLMYEWSSPAGVPEHLVAIDGRTNVNSEDVWRSVQKALFGQEGWQECIDRVRPQTILWRNGSPFVALLLESPHWCRVFRSGKSVQDVSVFVTREFFENRRGAFQSIDCS